jgi:hypothetical protein
MEAYKGESKGISFSSIKKKTKITSFFSKRLSPIPIVIAEKCTTLRTNIPLCAQVYIHYGPICLKKSVVFFSGFVKVKYRIYSSNCAQFNDNLLEIYLKNLSIRTDNSILYDAIKALWVFNKYI